MNKLIVLGAAALAAGGAIALASTRLPEDRGLAGRRGPAQGGLAAPPAIPTDPHRRPVVLRHAQRFALDEPTTHWWRAERPRYRSGWLVVLELDPDLVFPRALAEPVLYVGEQTAERVNVGNPSGRVVAIVPGDAPLAGARIFFGEPGYPERIDRARIRRELEAARVAGVEPVDADAVGDVLHDELRVATDRELRQAAIDLVAKWSSDEKSLIRGTRVPEVR